MEGFPAHFLRCSQDAHAALATRPSHSAMFGDIAHIVALLTLDHWKCPFTTEGLSSPNHSWLSSQTTLGFPAKLLLAVQPNYPWLSSQTTLGFPAKLLSFKCCPDCIWSWSSQDLPPSLPSSPRSSLVPPSNRPVPLAASGVFACWFKNNKILS